LYLYVLNNKINRYRNKQLLDKNDLIIKTLIMASITINTVEVSANRATSLTGNEQLLVTTKDGKSSTLTVN
jgi:hypothetical protein